METDSTQSLMQTSSDVSQATTATVSKQQIVEDTVNGDVNIDSISQCGILLGDDGGAAEVTSNRETAVTVAEDVSSVSLKCWLDAATYNAARLQCDLSYIKTYLHNEANYDKRKMSANRARIIEGILGEKAQTMKALSHLGYKSHSVIYGETGSRNQRLDATCLVSDKQGGNVIIVSFHGTVTLYGMELFVRGSDWGANRKFKRITVVRKFPTEDDLPTDIPRNVKFHGGYLRNYRSVHNELFEKLNELLRNNNKTDTDGITSRPQFRWIIFTGHSKGAGMAIIAAAIIKTYLNQHRNTSDVKIGVVAFSSPRVAYGDASRNWIYETLGGADNIIRVNVVGDIVTWFPFRLFGYRGVGVIRRERLNVVLERRLRAYPELTVSPCSCQCQANMLLRHYTHVHRFGHLLFDSNLVPSFNELFSEDKEQPGLEERISRS